MERRILLLTILALCTLFQTTLAADNEPILIGYGADAKWSPGDKSVSFVKHDTLFVKNLDTKTEAKPVFAGPIARYEWLDDSTFAVQTRVLTEISGGNLQVDRILRVPLLGLPQEIEKDSINIWAERGKELMLRRYANGSVEYDVNRGTEKGSSALTTGQKKPEPPADTLPLFVGTVPRDWGKVWLFYGSRNNGREVTQGANFYSLPELAPTCDKFFCYASRGDLVVFDTLGKELGNLGIVDMASWDQAGSSLVYCVVRCSEFDLEESDIFTANFDGSNVVRLTATPDILEVDPVFSSTRHYVLYREYGKGRVLVTKVK